MLKQMLVSMRMVLILGGFLLPYLAFGASSEAAKTRAVDESYLQLRITHTLTAAVFASYFSKMDTTYRPTYFADKNYLLTFLNVWSHHIESGRFTSSEQIFKQIKASKGFLGQHFALWEGLTADKGLPSIDLGLYRNTALAVIFRSESEMVSSPGSSPVRRSVSLRMAHLLDRLHFLVLSSSKDEQLMIAIATPFLESEDQLVAQRARDIIDSIPTQKVFEVLNVFRDPTHPGRPLKSIDRALGLVRHAIPFLRTQTKTLVNRGTQAENPIRKWLAGYGGPVLGSLGVHGAALGLAGNPGFGSGNDSGKGRDQAMTDVTSSTAKTGGGLSIASSLVALWDALQHLSPGLFSVDHEDFVPMIGVATPSQIVAEIRSAIGVFATPGLAPKAKWIDYFKIFLQAEKLKRIDQRPADDLLALHYSFGRLHQLERILLKALSNMKPDESLSRENVIELIRKIVIERELKAYKRDYPNLTSVTLGWGGNCVSHTMMLIGILKRIEHLVQFPNRMKLGVALTKDHIEAVLYNEDKVIMLMSGKVLPRNKSSIYRPEYLLYLVLRTLGSEKPLKFQHFLDTPPNALAERNASGLNFAEGLENPLKALSKLKQILLREGVLESIESNTALSWREEGTEEIPEQATVKFSELRPSSIRGVTGLSGVLQADPEVRLQQKKDESIKIITSSTAGSGRFAYPIVPIHDMKRIYVKTDAVNLELSTLKMRLQHDPREFWNAIHQVYHREVAAQPEFKKFQNMIGRLMTLEDIIRTEDKDLRFVDAVIGRLTSDYSEFRIGLGHLLHLHHCPTFNMNVSRFSRLSMVFFRPGCDHQFAAAPLVKALVEAIETRKRLEAEIWENPANFVAILNRATPVQRDFLLDLMTHIDSDNSVRAYLAALKKVTLRVTRKACSQSSIDLPTIESNESHWFYISPDTCKAPETLNDINQSADGVPIVDTVLIELSARTQGGFHLWTPQLVDSFLSNKMGIEAGRHLDLRYDLVRAIRAEKLHLVYPYLAPIFWSVEAEAKPSDESIHMTNPSSSTSSRSSSSSSKPSSSSSVPSSYRRSR